MPTTKKATFDFQDIVVVGRRRRRGRGGGGHALDVELTSWRKAEPGPLSQERGQQTLFEIFLPIRVAPVVLRALDILSISRQLRLLLCLKTYFWNKSKMRWHAFLGSSSLFCNTSQLLRLIIWGVVNNQLLAHWSVRLATYGGVLGEVPKSYVRPMLTHIAAPWVKTQPDDI